MKKLLSLVVVAGFLGMVVGCAAEAPKPKPADTKPKDTAPKTDEKPKPPEGK